MDHTIKPHNRKMQKKQLKSTSSSASLSLIKSGVQPVIGDCREQASGTDSPLGPEAHKGLAAKETLSHLTDKFIDLF